MPPAQSLLIFDCSTGQATIRAMTATEVTNLSNQQTTGQQQDTTATAVTKQAITTLKNAAAGTQVIDKTVMAAIVQILGL